MAGLKATDLSPTADAVLLAALFLPFAPIVSTFYLHMTTLALGCPADTAQACQLARFDFNQLYVQSVGILKWTALASSTAPLLLFYMLLVAGVAQITTKGFRGRIVRTCAVLMWAGVLPLVLGMASAMTKGPLGPGGNPLTNFAYFGNVFFDWLANTAVPIAVMATGLLALTLGYRALIGYMMRLVMKLI